MRVCLALGVVAQIKIAHDMQMSDFVQIAQYYSRTFFLALQYIMKRALKCKPSAIE